MAVSSAGYSQREVIPLIAGNYYYRPAVIVPPYKTTNLVRVSMYNGTDYPL